MGGNILCLTRALIASFDLHFRVTNPATLLCLSVLADIDKVIVDS